MKLQIVLGLCGAVLLLAAVSVGSGQSVSDRAKAVQSGPASEPAKDRTFRLRVYKRSSKEKELVFEKTYDAPASDNGSLLPKKPLGSTFAVIYDIMIDWPDNPPPRELGIRFYDYQVSRMTNPFKGASVAKNKPYLGKSNIQFLALKNVKEGDDMIQEAVELTVKDVKFRMSRWAEMLKEKK